MGVYLCWLVGGLAPWLSKPAIMRSCATPVPAPSGERRRQEDERLKRRVGVVAILRLRERRPGVVARLGWERVELRRSGGIHPWPSVPAPGGKERRLLSQVKRIGQHVITIIRIPAYRIVEEVVVAMRYRCAWRAGEGKISF